MKRRNEPGTIADKAVKPEGSVPDDTIVTTPRHHLLDEFAARPRLRPGKPDSGPKG